MRRCEYCGKEGLSYSPPIYGDYGTYFCLDCGKHSNPIKIIVSEWFDDYIEKQRIASRFNWIHIKTLYQGVKETITNLTIKDFHKTLLDMRNKKRVEFSRGFNS